MGRLLPGFVAAGLLAAFEQTVRPVVKSTGSFMHRRKAGARARPAGENRSGDFLKFR
jgi:hypothetical protein